LCGGRKIWSKLRADIRGRLPAILLTQPQWKMSYGDRFTALNCIAFIRVCLHTSCAEGQAVRYFISRLSAVFAIIIFFEHPSADAQEPRGNASFERNWSVCDIQSKPKPQAQERLEACNRVLAAGKSGGGVKDAQGTPRGVELYYGAYFDRSQAYTDLHRYNDAVADATYFLSIAPSIYGLKIVLGQAYANRALAYYYSGNYDKALADLDNQDAANREEFHGTTQDFLSAKLRGDVQMADGKYGAALAQYEAFAKVFPNDPGIAEKIYRARQLSNNPQLPTPVPVPLPPQSSDNPNPACKMYPNLC